MQLSHGAGQEGLQGQLAHYSLPPAPTFASLGAHSMPFTGSLGSLAQGHQQPALQPNQGLSAAVPPSAYLMTQQQQHQSQQALSMQTGHEKRTNKKDESAFGLVLPLHKVKRLIKSENSVKAVSGEASFAIARSTELLVEQLVVKAYQQMATDNRDAISYDDIAHVVSKWPATDFLRDIVPQTICLSDLMEMAKQKEEEAAS